MPTDDYLSSEAEILRRLDFLERSNEQLNKALQQLIISTTVTNTTLDYLVKILPKLERMEASINRNEMIMSLIKFVGGAIITVAVGMALYHLFGAK